MDGKKSGKSIGGILQGLPGLIGKLGGLGTGKRLQRSGTFEVTTENGEKIRGEYAVSLLFGPGNEPPIRPGHKHANDR